MKCDRFQNVEIVFGGQSTSQARTKAFLEELLWEAWPRWTFMRNEREAWYNTDGWLK